MRIARTLQADILHLGQNAREMYDLQTACGKFYSQTMTRKPLD